MRFGLSILQQVGIGELAVDNLACYIECAVKLSMDQELLDHLHRQLRGMMQASPLMDSHRYMQALENMYEKISALAERKK